MKELFEKNNENNKRINKKKKIKEDNYKKLKLKDNNSSKLIKNENNEEKKIKGIKYRLKKNFKN